MHNPSTRAVWRKSVRTQLIEQRLNLDSKTHATWSAAIDSHLKGFLQNIEQKVIAFCWPYQAEYDARSLMEHLLAQGAAGALPVVIAPRSPLCFRSWRTETETIPDKYGIPIPVGTQEVHPDIALVALNAFDEQGYRLGYGAGFFDRTLASMTTRPLCIGVGFEFSRISTIFPETHDIPMDFIATEEGIQHRKDNGLRRVSSGARVVFDMQTP
jgi:5-formyltetrahydrofolate cyclo-ligase